MLSDSFDLYAYTSAGFDIANNILWFVPYYAPVLCRYNLETHEASAIEIPEPDCVIGLSYNVKVYDDKVILSAGYSCYIYIYDIKKDRFCRHKLECTKDMIVKLYTSASFGNHIYFFPNYYTNVVRVDFNTDEILEIKNNMEGKRKFVSCTQIGSIVYLVNLTNIISVFDLNKEKFVEDIIGEKDEQYRTIVTVENGSIVLTDKTGDIIVIDINSKKRKKFKKISGLFFSSVVSDRSVYLFPDEKNNNIYKIDIDTSSMHNINIERIEWKKNDFDDMWLGNAFSDGICIDNKIYIMNPGNKSLMCFIIDKSEICETKIKLSIPIKSIGKKIMVLASNDDILSEFGDLLKINNFIKYITMK